MPDLEVHRLYGTTNGRTCSIHACCGKVVENASILRLVSCIVELDNHKDEGMKCFLVNNDGVDTCTALLDTWSDFDGELADDTTAELYFRTSDQATTDEELLLEDGSFFLLEDGTDKIQMESDIDFGAWTPMESGRYTGRQFQFMVELRTFRVDQTPLVDELGYTLQFDLRTESSATIASGAGAKVVTFADAFYQEPGIGITASNLASGDYYEVTSTSRTGFTITFFDSTDTAIDRNFQYQAVGYGTEQI